MNKRRRFKAKARRRIDRVIADGYNHFLSWLTQAGVR
jgi:hypothetical protein